MSYKYLLIIFSFLFFSIPINAADDWTQQSPPSNPQSRNSHEMAYIGDDNVIIFGGVSASHVRIGDTRIYDLSLDSWISMSPGLSPSSRSDFGMAYIGDDKALLFGGNDGNVDGESWCYDVSDGTWTSVGAATPTPPVAREALRLAYIGSDRVLLFGGLSGSSYFDETWYFDFSDGIWTKLTPASAPSGRHSHNMAYIGDDKVLLFGGNVSGTVNNETWVYDWSDNAWTNMNPATAPSARTNHSMSYIGDDKVILLGSSNADGTTWIYDLSDNIWTIDTNSSTPPGRVGAAMAISSLSGERRVVHFGGRDSALDFTNETWTFGGGDYPLPIELVSFAAVNSIKGVICKWSTESEIENLGFLLERKANDSDWKEIASYKTDKSLIGQGTTSSPTDYDYLDNLVKPSTIYEYRLADVDYDGVVTYHSVRTVTVDRAPLSSKVEKFTVLPAYPNPFNPSTTITYGLDTDSDVSIQIYDITGKLINTLLNTEQRHGWHSVIWNGIDNSNNQIPAGIYLGKITSNNTTKTTKLMLLK